MLNMDETPVLMCDAPVTAVVATDSKQAARISTTANHRLSITTFICIDRR